MKIFQLILSDSITGDLRYAEEIYNGFKIYFSEHEIYKHINNNKKLSKDIIDLINLYDYVFIYNLNDNKEQYIQLINEISCKKILFITNQNLKKFKSKINNEYINDLLSSCYKIVLNKNNKDFVNYISKITNKIEDNLIQLEYIYNPDYSVIDIPKHNEIIQISNKGLNSKYDLFIKLFECKNNYLNNFIWKIYGVSKNIQTLSINNLYINKKTNKKSEITNFNQNMTIKDKINVYGLVDNKKAKDIINNSFFVCCFDNYDFINYTILDIIYSGVIPIMNIKYAKNVKINNKQSLYDIINGVYINDKKIINDDVLVAISKYIQSQNSYKSLALRNIKICDQLFNPKMNITKLLNNI